MSRFQASPLTVQKAIATLVAEGVVETRPGVGTFVRRRTIVGPTDLGWQSTALGSTHGVSAPAAPLADPRLDSIALHGGYPTPDLLPVAAVRSSLARASRSPAAHSAAPAAGTAELRGWFAAELGAACRPDVPAPSPADVVVVPGSQAALSAIFRSVAGPHAAIVVESPTYWGAIQAARQAGVALVPVAAGPQGPDVANLERAVVDSGARAMYLQPQFANPTGALWPHRTRQEALDLAREHGLFLVEDDWARDFSIDGGEPPIAASDTDGHVIYLRSVTKSLSPALRVAAVVARGPVRRRILAECASTSMYVSPILQHAAVDVIGSAAWRRHRRALPEALRRRRDDLLSAVHRQLPEAAVDAVPRGGLNLWLRLPGHWDSGELAAACRVRDVQVAGGEEWFPTEPAGAFLRLNYAAIDPAVCDEGLSILAATARELYN